MYSTSQTDGDTQEAKQANKIAFFINYSIIMVVRLKERKISLLNLPDLKNTVAIQ